MQNIHEKIEQLYKTETNTPQWAKEIIKELKEIKTLLKNRENPRRHKKLNQDYYKFVDKFRQKLTANTNNDIYPEIIYKNRKIGVNFKGFLYDKETQNTLPSLEAFAIYEYFYQKKDEIEKYIIIN